MINESPWGEQELIDRICQREISLPPVQFRLVELEPGMRTGGADGVVEAEWQGRSARFVFEYKGLSTPKSLDGAILQARHYAREMGLLPLVILPYLPEKSLQRLEEEKVSGIDLCGNGILVAPGLAVWRSGQPNRFKDSQPIRNVFRGVSSILARCFLLRSEFPSLTNLGAFALDRVMERQGGNKEALLSKGTVSKVVRALEEEKILVRSKDAVRLAAPQILLERLQANYPKSRGRRIEGKMSIEGQEAWERLAGSGLRYVATGDGSAGRYRLLSGVDRLSLYVEDLEVARRLLDVTPGRIFPNVDLIEEESDLFYFDARLEGSARWASPIQTWLELSLGGPREREAAQTLETILQKGGAEALL